MKLGVDMAVRSVMAAPLSEFAVKATSVDVDDTAVAVPILGADGTLLLMLIVTDATDALLIPSELEQVTVNV
jgi:hypothetical protein